jgi:predicted glycosyltransferase
MSAVKKLKLVSDRMSYIVLRGCPCNSIVLNTHASTEEKNDDSKDSFYEELGRCSIIFLITIRKFC